MHTTKIKAHMINIINIKYLINYILKIKLYNIQESIRPIYQIPKIHPLIFKLLDLGIKIKLEIPPAKILNINLVLVKLHKVIFQMESKYR